jgi:hypothetical protein
MKQLPVPEIAYIKIGVFGKSELFDPKLMHLNFDPGVEN